MDSPRRLRRPHWRWIHTCCLAAVAVLTISPAALASLQNGPYEWPPQKFASFKACTDKLDEMYATSLLWQQTSRYSRADGWSDVSLMTDGIRWTGSNHATYKETRASIFTSVLDSKTISRSSETTESESVCDGRTMRTSVYDVAQEGTPAQVDVAAARRQSDERFAPPLPSNFCDGRPLTSLEAVLADPDAYLNKRVRIHVLISGDGKEYTDLAESEHGKAILATIDEESGNYGRTHPGGAESRDNLTDFKLKLREREGESYRFDITKFHYYRQISDVCGRLVGPANDRFFAMDDAHRESSYLLPWEAPGRKASRPSIKR